MHKTPPSATRFRPHGLFLLAACLLALTAPGVRAAVPVLTSPTSAVATAGLPFSYVICGKNTPTNYAAAPLPAGLAVDPFSGVISGTPVSAATNTLTISAGNASGTGTAALLLVVSPATTTRIEVYPGPGAGAYLSGLYTVDVNDGASWNASYTYQYSRSSALATWHAGSSPSLHFTTFGTTGPANVRISKIGGTVTSLSVSPVSKSIAAVVYNGQGILTLGPNDKVWVTINGDDTNPLFIFADPPKPAIPGGATYFGPGVTNIAPAAATNHYQARNNEVIYLDGGAWVRGNINVIGTTNVLIMGPGVLSGDLWTSEAVQALAFNQTMAYCMVIGDSASGNNNGCSVQGVTMVASPTYNLRYVNRATGVKLLSPWYWSTDGFYALHTDQCFAFVGDNVFFPLWYLGGSENVTIANSFGANDNNGLFCGGYWGFPATVAWAAVVDNVDLRTYDGAGGVFQSWVDNTNSTYGLRNHTYQNIRVEGSLANGPLLELKNYVYPWSGASAPNPPLGNSYNFAFRNISLQGTQSMLSQIYGYDASNVFHNVSLQDVTINGTRVTAANASGYIATNAFVSGVSFSTAGNKTISASAKVGGFISPRGAVAAAPGTSLTFLITPAPGCVISNVVVDSVSQGAITSCSFTNIAANHTIQAIFAAATSNAAPQITGFAINGDGAPRLDWCLTANGTGGLFALECATNLTLPSPWSVLTNISGSGNGSNSWIGPQPSFLVPQMFFRVVNTN